MKEDRYILAFLLKPAHGMDASNGGVSTMPGAQFYVPSPRGNITFEDIESANSSRISQELDPNNFILRLDKSGTRCFFRLPNPTGRMEQFGGCFIYASDSRFSETYGSSPIHLHDRFE